MKQIILLILLMQLTGRVDCQQSQKPVSDSCSRVLRDVSYYWQLDSLGQNGYRLCNYNRLVKSKIGRITSAQVLDKLGKPNFSNKTNVHYSYCYYFFDGRIIPKT